MNYELTIVKIHYSVHMGSFTLFKPKWVHNSLDRSVVDSKKLVERFRLASHGVHQGVGRPTIGGEYCEKVVFDG